MRGLLLHSPLHQQQLRRGAPRPAEGGTAAVAAGGSAAAARACKDPTCAWGNAGARAGARVYERRAGSPTHLEITHPDLDYNQMSSTCLSEI